MWTGILIYVIVLAVIFIIGYATHIDFLLFLPIILFFAPAFLEIIYECLKDLPKKKIIKYVALIILVVLIYVSVILLIINFKLVAHIVCILAGITGFAFIVLYIVSFFAFTEELINLLRLLFYFVVIPAFPLFIVAVVNRY